MPSPRPTSGRRLLIAALLLLCVPAGAAAAPAVGADQARKTLAKIEQRIRQTTASLDRKKAAEEAMERDLATVERERNKIQARITERQRQLADLEKEIDGAERQIQNTRSATAALQQQVRLRLVALYKGGNVGLLQFLFSATSPARVAEDYDYLGRIARRDRVLLVDYRRQLAVLQGQRDRLAVLRRDHQAALAALADERQTLDQASQLKAALLARLQRDRAALAARLKGLKERAGRLSSLLKKLESRQSREYTENSGVFPRQKGHLPWPVTGSVVTGFGTWRHPESGTLYDSQGIEIEAGEDTPIHAVWGGRVVFAKWFKGYGNLIIIDHGDSYYSLYAQAARLATKVGDRIDCGQVVGYSGYHGKKAVYFEIRHGGTPVNPTNWLSRR